MVVAVAQPRVAFDLVLGWVAHIDLVDYHQECLVVPASFAENTVCFVVLPQRSSLVGTILL